MCAKSCLLAVLWVDNNLVESFVGIEGGKVSLPRELGKYVVDPGNLVSIRSCDFVNFSKVDTEAVLPFLAN